MAKGTQMIYMMDAMEAPEFDGPSLHSMSSAVLRAIHDEREVRLLALNAEAEGPCCSVPVPAFTAGGFVVPFPMEPSYLLPGTIR